MGPDKRFLKLCETRLAFSIEIPDNYYLDNDVFAKMVETTQIIVNHDDITRKSTPLDNSVTSAIFNKLNMEAGLLNTCLGTHGVFSSRDIDAGQLTSNDKSVRDNIETKIIKEVTIDDEIYLIPYKRYFFVSNLNHGLAREFGVLPAEIPFRFRFNRARKEYLLLKTADHVMATKKADPRNQIQLDFAFPEPVVPFINPVLRCYYAYSPNLSSKMSRISSHAFQTDFLHYECRQQILDTSLDEYTIPIAQGPLPKIITFALSTLDRSRGNEAESLTRFCPLDLLEFDLIRSKYLLS